MLGRWVEARDLREGDVLKEISGKGLIVTGLSSRQERVEVFNLEVEGHHNYAVHKAGILVHNKGAAETKVSSGGVRPHDSVTLKHYEVSILGATDALALLSWMKENGYQINPAAQEVLDGYIHGDWNFVAVKLRPS